MTTQQGIDQAKTEAFVGKVLTDVTSTVATVMASIGDRLGLFKHLASSPATCAELAERAHIDERYAREWLSEMASAGYLAYDPTSQRFTLPPEHVPVLAEEGGPFFLGGAHQMLMAEIGPFNQLVQAFRQGGGVPMEAYGPDLWEGQARFSGGFFEHLLVPVWLPAMPEVQAKLERGALVADVGCGQGKTLIKLAQTYPQSRYVGYDLFAPSIATATANAQAAGVADRVRFEHRDVSEGLPDQYDIITTFDVVHDAIDPRRLLRAIREGLRPGGRYVCMEANGSDKLEENVGLAGSLFYGISVLYCMTTSLAGHGEGLGTLGLPETTLRAVCAEAGWSSVRRVAIEIPFNYVITGWGHRRVIILCGNSKEKRSMKRAGIGFPSRLVSLFSRLARRQTDALHPVSAYDPPDHRDIISPSDEMETQRKELPMNAVDILKYGHQTVLQAIEGFPETAVDVPGACGAWSAKDILAHLASYEHTLFEVLSTFANPHATPYLDRMSSLGNQFNDTEVEKRKGKSMKEILDEFNDTHTQVLELSTQISPETSRQSGTLPWYGMEYALDDFIVYTSYGHKCEHSAQIAAFRDRLRREAAVQEDALTATTVEVVEQLNEALNRRDVDAVMALMNDDVVFENTYPPPDGQRYEGRRALRAFFEDFFHATPHVDFQTEDLFASGNRCTARWVFHWSNTAGENGHIRGIDVINLRNGKVAENFSYVKG